MSKVTELLITTDDHIQLGATHYLPSNTSPPSYQIPLIVIAGATGTPQGFYKRFASAAVSHGCQVITFDYRGIGRSKPVSLKGYKMNYLDWAQKDLAAVIQYCARFDAPLYIVGHSYGGHAIGLLPDLSPIRGVWTFGTGAGWHGWMPKSEQLKVRFMWHIVAPILTRMYGFLAWSRLGMGEDLPLNVYKQWKRWCSFPHYFFDDPEMPQLKNLFSRVKFPVTAINADDDKWAPPSSRDAFMGYYHNAQLYLETLDSKQFDQQIGHMGYFRSHCESLWNSIFAAITMNNPQKN